MGTDSFKGLSGDSDTKRGMKFTTASICLWKLYSLPTVKKAVPFARVVYGFSYKPHLPVQTLSFRKAQKGPMYFKLAGLIERLIETGACIDLS